jgi:L-lactate dehydrogenase complex protein LldF
VITPHLKDQKEYKHLSFASSLCGKCTEVCPVKIDIHKLLLYNRRDAVENGYSVFAEKIGMIGYKKAMLNRNTLDAGGEFVKNKFSFVGKNAWGKMREIPRMKKSFSKQYIENHS